DLSDRLAVLFSHEILPDIILSLNYRNSTLARQDKVQHWQQAGLETYLSRDTSLLLEAERSAEYSNLDELLVNVGLRMLISHHTITSLLNLYAYDLNQVYSQTVLGLGIEFTF
ncbi:MAG: hypothetical protein PHW04_14250, partial [Candidatus Wallbacteria bacterium]|nr:hypothetical protein [Candidatus Wallbacteria bacterium]